MKITKIASVLALAAFSVCAAHAQTSNPLNPDPADASVMRATDGTISFNTGDYQSRIGEFFSGGSCYVFPFQVPTLAANNQFTGATLRMQLFGLAGTPVNADLYVLGLRTTPTVIASDYYQGATIDARPGTALLQAGFLTATSPVRTNPDSGPFITTSTAAGTTLANYLNTVGPNNTAAGQYIFLRVSYAIDPIPPGDNAYSLLTQNAGGTFEKPLLTLTSDVANVPEPSTMVLGGVAAAGLVIFRRRKS